MAAITCGPLHVTRIGGNKIEQIAACLHRVAIRESLLAGRRIPGQGTCLARHRFEQK
jgi:hypothetical protein